MRRHADALLADALTIAVKTVGIHVSHILRKLDFPNPRPSRRDRAPRQA